MEVIRELGQTGFVFEMARRPESKLVKLGWPVVMTPPCLILTLKVMMKEALTSSRTVPSVTLPTIEARIEKRAETRLVMTTRYSTFIFV